MATEIIVAGISLLGTLGGTFAGIVVSAKLTNFRISALERAVREHNNFARRVPVVEEQIKTLRQRLAELEKGGRYAG